MKAPIDLWTNPLWIPVQQDWGVADYTAARQQGWNIFAGVPDQTLKGGDPPFQVWRYDAQSILPDDASSHKLLRELVQSNDPVALRARDFLRLHCPEEYANVFLNY